MAAPPPNYEEAISGEMSKNEDNNTGADDRSITPVENHVSAGNEKAALNGFENHIYADENKSPAMNGVANKEERWSEVDLDEKWDGQIGEGEKKEKKEDEKKEKPKTVGVTSLFRYATGLDVFLIFLGILMACCNGCALPAMIIVFGDMIDSFIGDGSTTNAMQEIPWESYNTTFEEAMNDETVMENVMAKMNMTDVYNENKDKMMNDLLDQVKMFAIFYIIIGCCVLVAGYGQVTCFLLTSYRQTQKIRLALWKAILRQNIGWYDTQEVGELNTRLADDVNKIQEGLGDKIGSFFQWISACIAGIVIGFVYGWKLTLVIVAVSPLLAAGGGFMAMMTSKATSMELNAYAKAGAVAEEVLGAIRTVTAFGGQKKEIQRYTSHLGEAKKSGIKKGLIGGSGMGLVFFIMFACYALAFWYGAKLVREEPDNYTPGRMLIVFFAILIGAFSLGSAFPNLTVFGTAQGAAYMIWETIDRDPPIDCYSEEGESPDSVQGAITFSNVSFKYPSRPDVPVLNGLNVHIAPGQTAALVGNSGCGKSTTIQLMQRFYDPLEGSVQLDGKDIKSLNIKWLRRHIGVVSQEPVLFATTIADNIRNGRDDATQEDIEQAAQEANAHEFITKLPKGYDTLVGERGAQLSGGQKQRIAIARALVSDPKILLLDEATSALDTESEATVQAALDKARMGRTTIIVAHRLSTVRNAEVIFGIADGVTAESGSHDELMAKGGIYQTLVNNQQMQPEEEEEIDEEFQLAINPSDYEMDRKDSVRDDSKRGLKRGISVLSAGGKSSDGKEKKEDDIPEVGFGQVMKMNASEWYYVAIGCVAAIANGAVQPAFAIIFSEILGVFAIQDEEEKKQQILLYSMMFLVIGVGAGLAMFLQSLMFSLSGEALTLRIRERAFKSMLQQEIGYFDDHENSVGALCTRLSTQASAVQGATGSRLGTLFQSLASIGTGIVIGFIFSWKLTLVILLFIPAMGVAGMVEMKIMQGYAGKDSEALEGAGKVAVEGIENIRTVASLTKEEQFYQQYKDLTDPPYRKSLKKAHLVGIAFSFSQCLIYFAYAASFYFGAWLIVNDGLEFQNMFKVFSAIVFGAMAVGQASAFAPDYGKAKSAANRLFFLFNRESAIDSFAEDGDKPGNVQGAIEFKDVRFVYPTRPTAPVLRGLSFTAQPGETVALVGSSGCGKSTSVSLLERFYDPLLGEVCLDGNNLEILNVGWVRQQMGIVQQEPILFDTSIKENIAYGDNERDVPMDEIISAAKNANIHNFITTLPQGYDTNVGDKGAQLSGGQKQRVAIARALVRNPKILLLDEATSALDTESEKVVQEALDRAQTGRTSLVIAHRLSTIQNADKIIVIHNGHLFEEGTHAELMSAKGKYYKLAMRSN